MTKEETYAVYEMQRDVVRHEETMTDVDHVL